MTPPLSVLLVIPARYASTRLPGKPLLEIAGKPMIQHVWERANEVVAGAEPSGAAWSVRVLVATDDDRIVRAVEGFGGVAVKTDPAHPSGTDRLVEVAAAHPSALYINLQGDEPLLRPTDIQLLIEGMAADASVGAGTLCHALPASEATDPNQVKVVRAAHGDALYFSRSPIPYPREAGAARYWKHVGIYAYRSGILRDYGALVRPAIEEAECLEQLRLLYHGIRLRVWEVAPSGPGVDTPEDLENVRRLLSPN
jgi:3-deoxy-D-manno-octulosonate cytidylyltransferase